MFSFIGKWIASLGLSLASTILALNPLATTTPSTINNSPLTPEELATSLHDKITDLRAEVERAHFDAALPLTHPLSLGARGDDVTSLQKILVNLNDLPEDSATGYYGTATMNAVKNFQKTFYLPDTGTVDRATLDKLFEISIDHENLNAIYFPEESVLLGLATSSEALIEASEQADTSTTTTDTTDTSTLGAAPTTINVTVTGANYSFSPNSIVAHPGDVIVVHYTISSGTHNFVIDALNVKTANVASGRSIDFNFAASKTGTFTFYSSVSNDKAQGMTGTLTVQ